VFVLGDFVAADVGLRLIGAYPLVKIQQPPEFALSGEYRLSAGHSMGSSPSGTTTVAAFFGVDALLSASNAAAESNAPAARARQFTS
jgi:hypothetical protein